MSAASTASSAQRGSEPASQAALQSGARHMCCKALSLLWKQVPHAGQSPVTVKCRASRRRPWACAACAKGPVRLGQLATALNAPPFAIVVGEVGSCVCQFGPAGGEGRSLVADGLRQGSCEQVARG